MRATKLLLIVVASCIVTSSFLVAQAQPGSGGVGSSNATGPCAAERGNASVANMTAWRQACRQNMTTFLKLSIERFNENRTLLHLQLDAARAHIRASFMDGKVAAYNDCRAQTAGTGKNASGPHSGEFAACMKGMMPALRDAAKQHEKDNRTATEAALKTARETAKADFNAMRDAWLAANPKPTA